MTHRYEIVVTARPASPSWLGRLIFECRDLAEAEDVLATKDLGSRGESFKFSGTAGCLSDFERKAALRLFVKYGLPAPDFGVAMRRSQPPYPFAPPPYNPFERDKYGRLLDPYLSDDDLDRYVLNWREPAA